jgi:hypothetical protein
MEEELLPEIIDFEERPGTTVFHCARRLEIMIRTASGSPESLFGKDLINHTMKDGQVLEPKGPIPSEREAWANLFRGAFGAFRNPAGHRDQQLSHKEAFGQIMTINTLAHKLKTDFPDAFKQKKKQW